MFNEDNKEQDLCKSINSSLSKSSSAKWCCLEDQLGYDFAKSFPKKAKEFGVSIKDILNGEKPKYGLKFDRKVLNNAEMSQKWQFNFLLVRPEATGNCFSFNTEGNQDQNQPSLEGGLYVEFKRKLDLLNVTYILWVHTPRTLPSLLEEDYHLIKTGTTSKTIIFEIEERLNLPSPYGTCIQSFPQKMLDCYSDFKRYNYSRQTCYAFKYTGEIPILPSMPENIG